jgi:Niemann-Pick C1 protein
MTYLLNKNAFSLASAEEWERQVFIRNIKSFNYALGNDYHTDMTGPMEGLDYNMTLVNQIREFVANMSAADIPMILVKADYLAERSIEDNIVLETEQNSAIVVISYILMFFYVSMAIGFFPDPVHTKFGLGTAGILVVLGALISSIGLTFYFNQKLTMIGAEVVPFLILAIGVDNIFLISRAERTVPSEVKEVDMRIAYALKDIGPSIFAAATCEALAFFVGLLTDVPALQNFCLVAGLGVVTDFFLQMTIFIGALALDNRRIKENRADIIFCCKKREEVREVREEIIRSKFQQYYVPTLFTTPMKIVVFAITTCLVVIGVMSQYKLVLGLNQNVSLVQGSDIYDYFESLYTYGDAGPPCYLVFKDVNYTYPGNIDQMNLIAAQLATLNSTVLPPVYSWTTSYSNFINSAASWSKDCGSAQAAVLPFEEQMQAFVNIKILSTCCQSFGICGEQYSGDIIFDDFGSVTATRFRY